MVNPGAFIGSRRVFLDDQQELYAAAVADNHVADTVADIQRRYFKRYPVTLPHNQEPSDEWLAQVDDDAPDPEIAPPNQDSMDPAAYHLASSAYLEQVRELKMRREQIKRRLQYQYNKSRDDATSFDKASDTLAILMAKLTGEGIKKPRMKTPYNVWGPEHRYFVDPIFHQRVKENDVPARNQAALRSSIYKELFDELPEEERKEWSERAAREHREAIDEIQRKLKSGPSTLPEDRQRVIQALPKFIEPILDLIADASGWKLTLIAGGPEPADGGRLNMISIHSGVSTGSIKMNFGRSERRAYKDYIIPTFGSFLKKCYTIEECRSRALPVGHPETSLATLSIDEELDVHRFPLDANHIRPQGVGMKGLQKLLADEGFYSHPTDRRPKISANSTGNSSMQTAPPPVKFGPPKGAKKTNQSSALLKENASLSRTTKQVGAARSLVAATVAAAVPTATSSTLSVHFNHVAPTPSPPSPAHHAVDVFNPGISGASKISDGRTPSRPAHSRAPTPAPSPPSSRAPTPAPSPAPSRAPTPAPSESPPLLRAPTLESAPAPLPAPSRQPILAASPAPFKEPISVPSPESLPPSVSSISAPIPPSISAAIPVPILTTIPTSIPSPIPAPISPPISVASRAPLSAASAANKACELRDAVTPSPAAPDPSPPPITKPRLFKPSGAAAVPNLRALPAPATSSKNNRKRKGHENDAEEDGRETKRTRGAVSKAAGKRKATDDGDGPMQKKQKRMDDVHPSFIVQTPDNAPQWVIAAIKLITATDLGAEWKKVVEAWLEFEVGCNFEPGLNLGSHRRPKVVGDWIQRARKANYRPNIGNPVTFEKEFKSWWSSLQPEWRHVEGSEELRMADGDWEVLRRPGQNGLLSVVAALFFWGLAVADGNAVRGRWDAAITDVLYSLTQML